MQSHPPTYAVWFSELLLLEVLSLRFTASAQLDEHWLRKNRKRLFSPRSRDINYRSPLGFPALFLYYFIFERLGKLGLCSLALLPTHW